jgi:hypothetical protein
MSYSIDTTRQLVLTRAWGVLTDADLLEHKAQLANDSGFSASMAELSDVRGVERLAVTTEGVKLMVAHDVASSDRMAGHRLALVVSSDESFGMARMYSQRSDGGPQDVGVFRSMTEAEAWLAAGQRDETTTR